MNVAKFDMRWELTGPGWARLTWVVDDEALEIDTSYTGHGLQSFLRAVGDLKGGSSALLCEQPQGQVDAFDLTGPALVLGTAAPVTQIPFQLEQTRQHLRIHVQHWASDAGFSELDNLRLIVSGR